MKEGGYGRNKNNLRFLGKPNRNNNSAKKIESFIKRKNLPGAQLNSTDKKGIKNEQRFFRAFQNPNFKFPDYFISIEEASIDDDINGVDFFILMKEQVYMPVNIKSSLKGCFEFEAEKSSYKNYYYRRIIMPFAVLKKYNQITMLKKFFKLVDRWREEFLQQLAVKPAND